MKTTKFLKEMGVTLCCSGIALADTSDNRSGAFYSAWSGEQVEGETREYNSPEAAESTLLEKVAEYAALSKDFLLVAQKVQGATVKEDAVVQLRTLATSMSICADIVLDIKRQYPTLKKKTETEQKVQSIMETAVLNMLKAENKLHALVIPHIPNWAMDAIQGGLSQGARMRGNTKASPYTPKVKYEKGSLLYYWLDDRAANIASTMLVREYAPEVLRRNPEAVRQLMEERQRTAKELEKFSRDKGK